MEDARFVRFVGDDGAATYYATYTAYDGRHIRPRMFATDDFRTFKVPRSPAGRRQQGHGAVPAPGRRAPLALCRSDGETLGLTSPRVRRWRHPVPLTPPLGGWELIQVGNCGSPLETEAGWLVLTHGVGPMRRYAIGALLLDLDEPHRVVAALPGPLLAPEGAEREGYVPNVVYSCGGLLHSGALVAAVRGERRPDRVRPRAPRHPPGGDAAGRYGRGVSR